MDLDAYSLGLYEKSMPNSLSIEEKLLATKASGYDYLELSIDESEEKIKRLDWSMEEVSNIADMQRSVGIPIHSICLSAHRKYPLGHPSKEFRDKSLKIMYKAIDLASALGIRIIQLAGYDVYYEPSSIQTADLFARNLKTAVGMAAKKGVILAFETMETPFMDTIEKAMQWISYINSPYLQIYPDIGNLTNASKKYKHNFYDDYSIGAGHVVAVHLKETKTGIYREIPYGSGHVDFSNAIACAWQQGVRMYVGEFWYDNTQDWTETLVNNNRFLRTAIEKGRKNFVDKE